jgi:hypothetical protein
MSLTQKSSAAEGVPALIPVSEVDNFVVRFLRRSAPHPLANLSQPVQFTGGIGRVKHKMYILATDPARFTQFYDKLRNDPGWTVHTLPCHSFHPTRNARSSNSKCPTS